MQFLTGLLLLLMVPGLSAEAQGRPQFEAATVKSSTPVEAGAPLNINLGTIRNGVVTLTNATLSECIQFAYGIVSDSQIAGPDWIRSREVRFDVIAKAPAGAAREQLLMMLQDLLRERLSLTLHNEKREMSFLALVVAKNGPKLAPANPDGERPAQVAGRIVHPEMPMSVLASLLSRFQREIVIDMTGLTGSFAVNLRWTPDALRQLAPQDGRPLQINGQSVDVSWPSLYTALQEQLGLKLESRKGPVDILVVDHAERMPADN